PIRSHTRENIGSQPTRLPRSAYPRRDRGRIVSFARKVHLLVHSRTAEAQATSRLIASRASAPNAAPSPTSQSASRQSRAHGLASYSAETKNRTACANGSASETHPAAGATSL